MSYDRSAYGDNNCYLDADLRPGLQPLRKRASRPRGGPTAGQPLASSGGGADGASPPCHGCQEEQFEGGIDSVSMADMFPADPITPIDGGPVRVFRAVESQEGERNTSCCVSGQETVTGALLDEKPVYGEPKREYGEGEDRDYGTPPKKPFCYLKVFTSNSELYPAARKELKEAWQASIDDPDAGPHLHIKTPRLGPARGKSEVDSKLKVKQFSFMSVFWFDCGEDFLSADLQQYVSMQAIYKDGNVVRIGPDHWDFQPDTPKTFRRTTRTKNLKGAGRCKLFIVDCQVDAWGKNIKFLDLKTKKVIPEIKAGLLFRVVGIAKYRKAPDCIRIRQFYIDGDKKMSGMTEPFSDWGENWPKQLKGREQPKPKWPLSGRGPGDFK